MKFSEVQRMLLDGFGDTITPRDVKKALDIAFPGVVTERSTYINGIRLHTTPLVGPHAALAGPHAALAGPHAALADPHATLAGPHAALAENTSLKAENMSLKQERVRLCAQLDEVKGENAQLRQQIAALEKSNFSNISASMQQQMVALSSHVVGSQDITIQHVNTFSIERIISDFEHEAPDLILLFKALSQSSRNVCDNSLSVEGIKAIVSLFTLLNARTNRANRFQLLMSIMLIARATSKQVRISMEHAQHFVKYVIFPTFAGNNCLKPCRNMHVI